MRTLHDKIMKLSAGELTAIYLNRPDWIAYKTGHRDARHAAAELASEQDALVAQLVGALTKCADRAIGLDPFTLEEVLAALAHAKELQA